MKKIIWLFHVFRHNEHEVDVAKKLAEEIGVELRINKMRTDMGKEIFETAGVAIERDSDWIPEDKTTPLGVVVCCTTFGRITKPWLCSVKPPVSRVVVYFFSKLKLYASFKVAVRK